ncbi:MAG: DNA polymerase III subunit alpha [Flavobacteriales bacterium]
MHSHYSLRYGICSPEEVLDLYQTGGYAYALLADVNNTSAQLDFVRMAQKRGQKALLGVDFRNGATRVYLVIARNNKGIREINDHLAAHIHPKHPFPQRAPHFEHCSVVYPYSSPVVDHPSLHPHEYITIEPHELNRFRVNGVAYKHPCIALPTQTFRSKTDFNTHRLLRAIDTNTLLSKLPKAQEAHPDDRYRSAQELATLYADFPELTDAADALLDGCELHFEFGTDKPHKNQKTYTGSADDDERLIRKLCNDGLAYRYPNPDEKILQRIDKELSIISEKQFTAYFLINWDITSYARSKGYFYVGRGSGANSVVAYLLRITDVDPIELDLYFERFINLYRQNPPDFDIDFSWTDRDDVTRYIFERFPNVCLLGAYNTFQYRAVVRELGKVIGLPKHEIDRLSDGRFSMHELDELSRLVIRYSERIHGFPNSLGIHAAGILITETHIHDHVATFFPPKGFPTAQFDMLIAEDAGFYKFDILSQRGLGKIKDSLGIIAENRPEAEQIDIHDLNRFKRDERVKHCLRTADAIGCFYIESPAMRMLMRKLRVDDYLGLVAASSVIRPGVAKSGMMREYILRYRFPEKRADAHPVMLDIMPDTFGVMVYQEDVIKVAHYFAGLTLAEADVLRRGMSGKFRSREEFEKAKEQFFINCRERGHDDALSAEVWRQIESFAGYAFAKGHSASYAVESYQSLFLKAHYPLEYMVATLNNSGGFYSTELYVHEARMKGARISPPCVNRGRGEAVIFGDEIVLGMQFIKGIDAQTIDRVVRARDDGVFASLEDLVDRTGMGLEQLTLLVRAGAMSFTGETKKALLWKAHFVLGHAPPPVATAKLFGRPQGSLPELPPLHNDPYDDAFDELELFGFTLGDPFSLLRNEAEVEPLLAAELPGLIGQRVSITGYLVTAKLTSTTKREQMYFGTFLDRAGDWLDTVHFPDIARRYPFRGRGVYRIFGKVVEEFDCISIEVAEMERMALVSRE